MKSKKRKLYQLAPVLLCSLLWILWLSNMGSIACPETSVRNYHSLPHNISEQRRYDLAMQVLVWLCMVDFQAILFGAVWFSASYANLGQPNTFT
jgi:hypothetical protein